MKQRVSRFFRRQWLIIKNEFTAEPWQTQVKNNILIILGALVLALGNSFFLLPFDIVSGGLTSIAIIMNSFPALSVISVDNYILILSWGFFLIGLIVLGVKYSLRTLVFTTCYPLFIKLFDWIIDIAVVDGVRIFDLTQLSDISLANGSVIAADQTLAIAYIAGACIGGILVGCGIGIAMLGGGSSGGTDVINLTVNKYFHVKVGTSSLVCDIVIILVGFFTTNNFNLLPTIVGAASAILCSIMIDVVFTGKNKSFVALIVTNKWYEINKAISDVLGRGATLLKGQGGYSREDTMVIETCFDRRDYHEFEQIVKKIDPNAFMTVMKAQEVVGYGFTRDTPLVPQAELALDQEDVDYYLKKAEKKGAKVRAKEAKLAEKNRKNRQNEIHAETENTEETADISDNKED